MPNDDSRTDKRARLDEFRDHRFDSVFSAAQSALKSAFLVNGGGAVAIMTFVGQATQEGHAHIETHGLAVALLILVAGTAIAAVATGFSFLAQYGYFMRRSRSWFGRVAGRLTLMNIVLVGLSYGCFIAAGVAVYVALVRN